MHEKDFELYVTLSESHPLEGHIYVLARRLNHFLSASVGHYACVSKDSVQRRVHVLSYTPFTYSI